MSYRLNTQLFRVNRTIKADAENYLYYHHPFVLVSYKWSGLDNRLINIIPKMSSNKSHIQKMKHYSMHIHLASGDFNTERATSLGNYEPQLEWFLMFADDLDILAAAFNLELQFVCGPTILIGVGGDLTARQADDLGCKASVSFKLFNTKFRTMTPALQGKLFGSLQGLLVGEGLEVTVMGDAVDPAEVERLRNIMSPSLVFSDAKMWSCGRALRKLMWACGAEVDEGYYEKAFQTYIALVEFTEPQIFDAEDLAWPGVGPSDDVSSSYNVITYDCLVAAGLLAFRQDDMGFLDVAMELSGNLLLSDTRVKQAICGWTAFVSPTPPCDREWRLTCDIFPGSVAPGHAQPDPRTLQRTLHLCVNQSGTA